jgi:predicted RNA-binding Zn-ribbon protein involved in translation (DUF1610 family)
MIEMESEMETKTWILTCETQDCENSGIPIPLETPATYFICGPCGNQITNFTEAQQP